MVSADGTGSRRNRHHFADHLGGLDRRNDARDVAFFVDAGEDEDLDAGHENLFNAEHFVAGAKRYHQFLIFSERPLHGLDLSDYDGARVLRDGFPLRRDFAGSDGRTASITVFFVKSPSPDSRALCRDCRLSCTLRC